MAGGGGGGGPGFPRGGNVTQTQRGKQRKLGLVGGGVQNLCLQIR